MSGPLCFEYNPRALGDALGRTPSPRGPLTRTWAYYPPGTRTRSTFNFEAFNFEVERIRPEAGFQLKNKAAPASNMHFAS